MIITESQLRNMIRKTIRESLDEVGDMDALAGAAAHGRMSMGDNNSLQDITDLTPEEKFETPSSPAMKELLTRLSQNKNTKARSLKPSSRLYSESFEAELMDDIYMDIVDVACEYSTCTRQECIEKVYHETTDPKHAPASTPSSMIDVQGYYPTLQDLLDRCL